MKWAWVVAGLHGLIGSTILFGTLVPLSGIVMLLGWLLLVLIPPKAD